MSQIAVITDSNSGITQSEAKDMGLYVIPMPFMIDGETYFEDINLTQREFYEKLTTGAEISTSQPSPEAVMKLWDEVLAEYDEIVYIPMSSGLSGSCQSALMLAGEDEYEDRVFVVNNQRISVTQRQSCIDAKELIKRGKSGAEIKRILEADKFNSSIYIMLDTLYYLKKGGRITPAAAALGTLLKLKPVLQIQGEKLDAYSKARTTAAGKQTMVAAMTNDINTRFGGVLENNFYLEVAYTYDIENANKFKKELEEIFSRDDIIMDPLSLSVACHIGPGSLAIACCQKMDYDKV